MSTSEMLAAIDESLGDKTCTILKMLKFHICELEQKLDERPPSVDVSTHAHLLKIYGDPRSRDNHPFPT